MKKGFLVFTLILFMANVFSIQWTVDIDAQNLYTYHSDVCTFNLENKTITNIVPQAFNMEEIGKAVCNHNPNKTEYSFIVPIDQIPEVVTVENFNHSSLMNIQTRPSVSAVKHIANIFLKKIKLQLPADTDETVKIKNISAFRVLIYKIASNPVGLRMLHRILDRLNEANNIVFQFGQEFSYVDGAQNKLFFLPMIDFAENVANRKDGYIYGCKKGKRGAVLVQQQRPYYMGLVHELIHLMHYLENRRDVGSFIGYGSNEEYDFQTINDDDRRRLWGEGDDLHTIWGIHINSHNFEYEYDNVSELTFRVADRIPIRMFCPQEDISINIGLSNMLHAGFEKPVKYYNVLKMILRLQNCDSIITIAR